MEDWDSLVLAMVKHNASDSLLNGRISDDTTLLRHEIEPPVFETWNSDKTVVFGKKCVEITWKFGNNLILHSVLDDINNLAFKGVLEHVDESIPEAAMNLEREVTLIKRVEVVVA